LVSRLGARYCRLAFRLSLAISKFPLAHPSFPVARVLVQMSNPPFSCGALVGDGSYALLLTFQWWNFFPPYVSPTFFATELFPTPPLAIPYCPPICPRHLRSSSIDDHFSPTDPVPCMTNTDFPRSLCWRLSPTTPARPPLKIVDVGLRGLQHMKWLRVQLSQRFFLGSAPIPPWP